MRKLLVSTVLALASLGITVPATAAGTVAPAAPAAPVAAPKYSTTETEIGTLVDDPAARAILDRHIPGLTTNPQLEMARTMTLKAIQPFASDDVTDERLAFIDAELAKLPK